LKNYLLLAEAAGIHLLSICFFLILLQIFSIVIFKITKGFDIELIFTLVNKKGSHYKGLRPKIDMRIRTILYLGCGQKKSPLCSGRISIFDFGIWILD